MIEKAELYDSRARSSNVKFEWKKLKAGTFEDPWKALVHRVLTLTDPTQIGLEECVLPLIRTRQIQRWKSRHDSNKQIKFESLK